MLTLNEVNTFHGHLHVLHDITFTVEPGEIFAIVGANGAGKSTLLGTIAGLYVPRRGVIVFEGKPLPYGRAERIVRLGLSLVPERRQIFNDLSVRDNLFLGAYHRMRRRDPSVMDDFRQVLRLFPRLESMLDRPGGLLSGGEQQMLAIGRGLMARPKLIMLDEPSLGLAPLIVQEIFRSLVEMRETYGLTVLLVEQNVRAALSIADRAIVLERGRVALAGNARALLEDESVRRTYLGVKGDDVHRRRA
ncbi:ABC transporter ATP-binding protein [Hydrogenibacillus sp. N12]|uniref:ABC transporter ATP-binding protein n=1 Tax=Hydrogenibacillus sp. N12 TaxID=2866627 RepID=UPI001C7D885D|nr:ABC transporter ATP-binding protein [Hydrogenibacillus sp. N12]QZA31984.1 ABC transporter ATP-binding protein [Hydrogenibacillus sp. N12]